METERLGQQVASVERNMAFLKQEHFAMLTGLQMEITHLKRRCKELSCELDSTFPDRTIAVEEAELAARCDAAQRLLEEQQGVALAVRGQLRAGQARASALGVSLRGEERLFLDELKRRSHKVATLSRELHRQTAATTALCRQLHTARLRLHHRRQQQQCAHRPAGGNSEEAGAGDEEAEEGEVEEEEEEEEDWLLSPPPPPDTELCRRLSAREERVRACVPRERVTSPQRPHPMPDPALFLVPLRYRLLRWRRPDRSRDKGTPEDEWEDVDERGVHRRVDMGPAEGETAL